MLPAQFRPHRIEFVGEAIRGIGGQHIVGQIETVVVDDGLLSNKIEMIARHGQKTRRRGGRSNSGQGGFDSLVLGILDAPLAAVFLDHEDQACQRRPHRE